MKQYDLRSDTVTLPSGDMRKAMYRADVGDDVYGEDPTVNALQELACKITGKKGALFVTSGSLANLIAIMGQCRRGNLVFAQADSHIFHFELSSLSTIAGVMPVFLPGERGIVDPDAVKSRIPKEYYYLPRPGMIVIENTHNNAGGTFYKLDELKEISDFARKFSLPIHMDGARLFNASIASGIPVKKICTFTDSVSFCLSKGLGAPVGSVICGSLKFIEEARRLRKMLGGGMRQAGVLAAAGIYALEHNIPKLETDHRNAKKIAINLQGLPWAKIDPDTVETNIMYVETPLHPAEVVANALRKKGVLVSTLGERRFRIVTHLGIGEDDIDRICDILRNLRVWDWNLKAGE